mmetsp:Transcript_5900/g.20768  ORF Transcript_5900/g.20768 Transcript_5900/m.20768 type:complete len:247 (+) Transcript_5900:151-891(+)
MGSTARVVEAHTFARVVCRAFELRSRAWRRAIGWFSSVAFLFAWIPVASFDPLDLSTLLSFRIDVDLLRVRNASRRTAPSSFAVDVDTSWFRCFERRRSRFPTTTSGPSVARVVHHGHVVPKGDPNQILSWFRHVTSISTKRRVVVEASPHVFARAFLLSHAWNETKRRPFVDRRDPSRLRSCIGSGYVATWCTRGPVRHERCRGRVQVVGGRKRHEPRPCQERQTGRNETCGTRETRSAQRNLGT